MRNCLFILFLSVFISAVFISTADAAYLDECLTKVVMKDDGTFVAAVQCGHLDFFLDIDKDGRVIKRNYVPPELRDKVVLVDFKPEDRMYLIYTPDDSYGNYRGMVCDFDWNVKFETGLEGMIWLTMANGSWWGIVSGPKIRMVSFDGYEKKDFPLPEMKGVDLHDLMGFTVDPKGDFILLFCNRGEDGSSGDGIIRKIRNGKVITQWIVDVPYVPENKIYIQWLNPVVDLEGNIYIAHYENPCDARNDDRVRIHKFTPQGSEEWVWGEKLFIISDVRVSNDGTIVVLRPGGPIYSLSQKLEYKGQTLIDGITILGEPECGKAK
jgi:hypothetical protein